MIARPRRRRGARRHKLVLNGQEVSRREFFRKRATGVPVGTTTAYGTARPLKSLALSCHRDCAKAYNAEAKRQGLTGIKWAPNGDCEITSRRDRAKWLRSQKQHDEDGGYGDG